jgi:uncharacterized protein (TIGR02246 family)
MVRRSWGLAREDRMTLVPWRGVLLRTAACLAVACLAAGAAAQTPQEDADREFRAQDWAAAARAYEALVRSQPEDGRAHFRLGVALHSLGRLPEAARALEAAERLGGPAPATSVRLAQVYARLDRKDDAVAALKRAIEAGFATPSLLDSDPDLKRLDVDPRMAETRLAVDRNARPCVYAPEYRQLDFWVGEWDVTSATGPPGAPPARSRVELIEDQCVIFESYQTSTGYSGRSLNTYDPEKRRWEQFWVDNKGQIHHYVGHSRDGNLYYEADGIRTSGPGSPPAKVKMTFFDQGPDQVRQLGEQSTDGGETWTVAYDLTYRRRVPASGGGPCAADAQAASALRAVATGIVEADNARALERVLAHYAADAVLLPPGEAPVSGRDAIRPRYESLFASFDPAIESRVDEACASGSVGYVRGHNGGRLIARGAARDRELDDWYLMLLRKGPDQKWRISHLIWH